MKNFEVVAPTLNIRVGPGLDYESVGTISQGEVVESPEATGWIPINLDDGTTGWVSAKFAKDAPEEVEAAPVAPTVPIAAGAVPWVDWALSKVGLKEYPGSADNPEIITWFKYTTLPPSMWHDSTAWCAVFCNAALFLNGKKGDRSARAVDFLGWGIPVSVPQKGDLVIFDFGGGDHHVAIYLGDAGSRVRVVGGNQSDGVTDTTYGKQYVMGYRRAA